MWCWIEENIFRNLVKRITGWSPEKQHWGVDDLGQSSVQFEDIAGYWRGLEDAPSDGGGVIREDESSQLEQWVDLKYIHLTLNILLKLLKERKLPGFIVSQKLSKLLPEKVSFLLDEF